MIHRSHPGDRIHGPYVSDPFRALLEKLRHGVEAMENPEIAAQVVAYFEDHPTYSRDLIYIAAVASRFQSEKAHRTADAPKPARVLSQLN